MERSEFGLIDGIRSMFSGPENVRGIGDDCAVLPQASGTDTLVSTDMLVEGAHFLMDRISPYQLGWKSAAVNISDIAAMGGRPVATFLSFALPSRLSDDWIAAFMEGYRDVSNRYSVSLLGGDTTSSPESLCINVAVMGECPHGKAVLRSGARPGDLVCVTGTLGDSAAGLEAILRHIPEDRLVLREINRHYLPKPRVQEGLALASMDGIGAMMDISDGVGSDIRHIMEESGVGAVIDCDILPLSEDFRNLCAREGWDRKRLALSGGEDYELLFTCREGSTVPVPHTVIGRIVSGNSLEWKGSDDDYTGFRHF